MLKGTREPRRVWGVSVRSGHQIVVTARAGFDSRWQGRDGGRSRSRGVTLIELMLGLVVASILSTIIYAVIVSQSRAYNIQDRMTQMQQSLRLAMEFITRDIAMAGYGTPGYVITDSDLGDSGRLPAIRGFDGGVGMSDYLQTVYADPTYMAMTRWGVNQPCGGNTIQFQNLEDIYNFIESEYMLCFDYSSQTKMKSFLVRLAGYDAATGQLAPGSYDPDNGTVKVEMPDNVADFSGAGGECPTGENLPRDLQCGPARIHTYYIDMSSSDGIGPGTPAHPVLMMSTNIQAANGTNRVSQTAGIHDHDIALADNIELIQLLVCRATSANCKSTDFEVWQSAFNAASAVTDIRQVKVTLWARSDRPAAEGASGGDPHPLFGFLDGYYRRPETTTVLVRNLRLLSAYH